MDLLTIGGIAAAVVVVCIVGVIIFKSLSRETTFEEAYGDNALKLLANQPNAEKTNKKEKHKHKPKRKASPKNESNKSNRNDTEIAPRQPKFVEKKSASPKLNVKNPEIGTESQQREKEKKAEKSSEVSKQSTEKIEEVTKRKEKSKTPPSTKQKIEEAKQNDEVVEGKLEENCGKMVEEQQVENTVLNGKTTEVSMEEKETEVQQHQNPPKKTKKRVSIKDISMQKMLERLQEIGELEPEYLTFLQGSADEVKAKENKLCTELKELKSEKNESEKRMKQALVKLEDLQADMDKIIKEKKEQNDRHVIFEQTVRQKLMETLQLKEENKKLADQIGQATSKLMQIEHLTQKAAVMQSELIKSREEVNQHKRYAETMAAESMELKKDAEEALHKSRMNFEGTVQTLQAELKSERGLRATMENEYQRTKNMVDQLISDMSNNENQVKEAVLTKSACENKIQALQNELNRDKDHHMQVMRNAQSQIVELSQDLEKAMIAYKGLAHQQHNDSTKFGEMIARNQQLDEEIGRLKSQVQSAKADDEFKTKIDDLNKSLDDQKKRNQDLRETNYKLMESIKKSQSDATHYQMSNGGSNNGISAAGHVVQFPESKVQIERLNVENQKYKLSLDSVKKQLEMVSHVAEEMERDKNAKIAKLEEKLKEYEG